MEQLGEIPDWLLKVQHRKLNWPSEAVFVASLRLLVQRERYSIQDIGAFFGVSRQRAHQWMKKYKILHPDRRAERGLMMYRVWDDNLNRFTPIPKHEYYQLRRHTRSSAKRDSQRTVVAARRRAMIQQLIELKEAVGRDPSLKEMCLKILGPPFESGSVARLVNQWESRGTTKQRYALFRSGIEKACGIKRRPTGLVVEGSVTRDDSREIG